MVNSAHERMNPVQRLTHAVTGAHSRMSVVPTEDLRAVLALIPDALPDLDEPDDTVRLGLADAEALARAAWDTSTGEVGDPDAAGRLERYGAFDSQPREVRDHQTDAARRTIRDLIEQRGTIR